MNKYLANMYRAIGGLIVIAPSTAFAAEVTIAHSDRDTFNSPAVVQLLGQPWQVVGGSYQVRVLSDGSTGTPLSNFEATRNFFTFDLTAATGNITSAQLRIYHPPTSYNSPDASETVHLFDVTTPTATLRNPPESGGDLNVLQAIFDDLGSGTLFGSFDATLSDNGATEIVTLNAAAIASLNAARNSGAPWSIGGSLVSGGSARTFGAIERVFRASDSSGGTAKPATLLVLQVADPPPPPPATSLLSIQSSLNFGTVLPSQTTSMTLLILNIDTIRSVDAITLQIDASTPFSIATHDCASLTAGSACDATIVYAPTATGSHTATLRVRSTVGSANFEQTVALSGTGAPPPQPAPEALQISPGNLAFVETRFSGAATLPVAFVNVDASRSIAITHLVLEGTHASELSVVNTCTTVPANQTCAVSVVFQPTSSGNKTASLRIGASNRSVDHLIAISGVASRDGDGVDDAIENAAPNNGDGNGDGVRDSEQPHVSSVRNAQGVYVTVEAPARTQFHQARVTVDRRLRLPQGALLFDEAVIGFELDELAPGSEAIVRLIYPIGTPLASYYGYGGNTTQWQSLAGATVNGNAVSFGCRDGGSTDLDGAVNGRCVNTGAANVSGNEGYLFAPFVDAGYLLNASDAAGTLRESWRFEGINQFRNTQSYFTGNQQLGNIAIDRRSFFAFDLSGIAQQVQSATLVLYMPEPNSLNANTPGYLSPDPEETFQLLPVERYSLAQLRALSVTRGVADPSIVPPWEDLGDGAPLAERVLTAANVGAFIEMAMNARGVQAADAATSTLLIGGRVATLTRGPGTREWLFNGTLIDSSVGGATPAPQLILRVTAPSVSTSPPSANAPQPTVELPTSTGGTGAFGVPMLLTLLSMACRRYAARAFILTLFVASLLATTTFAATDFTLIGVESDEDAVNHPAPTTLHSPVKDMTYLRAGDTQSALLKLNHNSGVLDIQETDRKVGPPVDALSLIEFTKLEASLRAFGWDASNAAQLQATLRLRVLVDTAPRLIGSDASIYYPVQLGIDPPPPSVPVEIHLQRGAWLEGEGQGNYARATISSEALHRLSIGMVGLDLKTTHLLLSQDSGLFIENGALFWRDDNTGTTQQLILSDVRIDKPTDRWARFDITQAVREGLQNGFAHGFALVHPGGDTATVRNNNFPFSRVTVSFASSNAAADCQSAGGKWGADGESAVFEDANLNCRVPGDFGSDGLPRRVAPRVVAEWRPRIVIEHVNPAFATALAVPSRVQFSDTAVNDSTTAQIVFINTGDTPIGIDEIRIAGTDSGLFTIETHRCATVAANTTCGESLRFVPITAGVKQAELNVVASGRSFGVALRATAGEDRDGVPDATEDAATNNGDGNADGIADRMQDRVASIATVFDQRISFVGPQNTVLSNVRAIDNPPGTLPAEERFELGLWSFDVANVTPGNTVAVTLRLPANFRAGRYFAYGSTASNTASHWHAIDSSGAQIITLSLVDGGVGDNDGQANGRIVHLGGLARSTADGTTTAASTTRLTDTGVGAIGFAASALLLMLAVMRRLGQRR